MEKPESQNKIEVEPQAKILIIDLQPLTKQNKAIASKMFEAEHENLDDFPHLEVKSIKAPKLSEAGSPEAREEQAKLTLPESLDRYKGIIVTGSPFAAYPRDKEGKPFVAEWKYDVIKFLREARKQKIPILGVCLGCQLLAEAFGGKAVEMQTREGKKVEEIGWGQVKRSPDSFGDPVMEDVEDEFTVPEHHGDVIAKMPEGAVVIAENEYGVQGFRMKEGDWCAWGFQFHAERSPKKVEEQLEELIKKGRTKEEIDAAKEKGKSYTGNIRRIFNNFLKFAWKKAQ